MNDLKKNLIEASKTYFFGEISKYDTKYTASPVYYNDKAQSQTSNNKIGKEHRYEKLGSMYV